MIRFPQSRFRCLQLIHCFPIQYCRLFRSSWNHPLDSMETR
jgi:hypothetical protein